MTRLANLLCLFLVTGALLLAGCASPQMKGTPFFTGEYTERRGPVEDRVNVWPLLYYRDPALSVLWPLAELTDDHFALRPLTSVYGLNDKDPVVNVLWPLAKFDGKTGNHRIFPIFWGKDYRVIFPLFWHRGHPFGDKGGFNGLLPLWAYSSNERGSSMHVLWPFLHYKNRGTEHGWRLWPLAGSYVDDHSAYRFLFWPLGHQWSQDNGESGHMFLPLYVKQRDGSGERFLSIPYSSRRRNDGSGWQLVPPLFYRSADNERSFFVSPLYTGGRSKDGNDRWSLCFPLFFHSQDNNDSVFISLPWMSGRTGTDDSWQLAPPLWFRRHTTAADILATPLFASGRSSDENLRWHAVLPLYYRSVSDDGKLLVTLAGGFQTDSRGRRWLLYPLLSGGRRDAEGGEIWAVAPIFHAEWGAGGTSHHLLPFYYWHGKSETFASLLAARWTDDHKRKTTLVPPLLSMLRKGEDRNDLWFLAGMGKASWGSDPGARYLAPLLYSNPKTGTFLSLPWSQWEANGVDYRVAPLLLSGYATDGRSTDISALLGIFRHHTSDKAIDRYGHFIPFYHYEGNRTFMTPLFGWNRDPVDGFTYPFTPLAAWRTGNYSGGWIFPLFSHKRSRTEDRCEGSFLWGRYRRNGKEFRSGIFPLYAYRNDGPLDMIPEKNVRYATRGKRLFFFPACWYRNQLRVRPRPATGSRNPESGQARKPRPARRTHIRKHGVFPLWSYSCKTELATESTNTTGSLLLMLYDYRRTVDPGTDDDDPSVNDCTRARLLWRLWHYERTNGDVSVDMFPAITYDRKKDGFIRLSFLWRFFRYENGTDGRKLDLLFLPIMGGNRNE